MLPLTDLLTSCRTQLLTGYTWAAQHRFRVFVCAAVLLLVYTKDISVQFGADESGVPTAAAATPTMASAVPTNFWSRVERPATKPVGKKRQQQLTYLAQHADLAVREMHASGIPASITLAQALLESNVGRSTLATRNNNHFGIKCFSRTCRKGHCSNFDDDSHKDFFRVYADTEASFRAHSAFLQKGKRYQQLFSLRADDYEGWAHGLKKAGYATDKRYAHKLIGLIEALDLTRYDSL